MRSAALAASLALCAALAPAQPSKPAPKPADPARVAAVAEHARAFRAKLDAPPIVSPDVAVFADAVERAVRLKTLTTEPAVAQAEALLREGESRLASFRRGESPWLKTRGRPVPLGYFSFVDATLQPFAVTLPADWDADATPRRLDVVLHGRDDSLTPAKFLASKLSGKGDLAPPGAVVLEPFGRGNNAYRWAGETDVLEAIDAVRSRLHDQIDPRRVVLRGFSMGGAGTWHLGLHYPQRWCAVGPGAGFATTRGYLKGLPERLPEHQEKCLTIYDAVAAAENAHDVPVVSYAGDKDTQQESSRLMKERFDALGIPSTRLLAPGLGHTMPAEWQRRALAEYERFAGPGRAEWPERVRFVTHSLIHPQGDGVRIEAMGEHYRPARIDLRRAGTEWACSTENVRRLAIHLPFEPDTFPRPTRVVIDGTPLAIPPKRAVTVWLRRVGGRWAIGPTPAESHGEPPVKGLGLTGPIDHAFMRHFVCDFGDPGAAGTHPAVAQAARAELGRFRATWDRHMHGKLIEIGGAELPSRWGGSVSVLFGDPGSNPRIAAALPGLPITWTRDTLTVNGVSYDPATHYPVLIYPRGEVGYVVLNTGHTFGDADFRGTNALLYPRLGDWAVMRIDPKRPDAAPVPVAAGLFDDDWRFPASRVPPAAR